jgi:ABC-type ATPase involved in cell division
MIRFDKVSKVYSGGHQALQKVSFHLRKGEMAFLTGHSGAGKSTLLKLISVMERRPTAASSSTAMTSATSSAVRSPTCAARSA